MASQGEGEAAAASSSTTADETPEDPLEACRQAKMKLYKTYDEVPENQRRRVRLSCFPPSPEVAAKLNLQYCMRCLHHDQDTGGFFIALIRKVAPTPAWVDLAALREGREVKDTDLVVDEAAPLAVEEGEEGRGGGGGGGQDGKGGRGGGKPKPPGKFCSFTPFEYYTAFGEEGAAKLREFYGLGPSFNSKGLFCRTGGSKILSYVTQPLRADVVEVPDSKIQVSIGTNENGILVMIMIVLRTASCKSYFSSP